jgi:hypothetical protein
VFTQLQGLQLPSEDLTQPSSSQYLQPQDRLSLPDIKRAHSLSQAGQQQNINTPGQQGCTQWSTPPRQSTPSLLTQPEPSINLTSDPADKLLRVPELHHHSPEQQSVWLSKLSCCSTPLEDLATHVPRIPPGPLLIQLLRHHSVPFSRAAWLIKVLYWHQARPGVASAAAATPATAGGASGGSSGAAAVLSGMTRSCSSSFTADLLALLDQLLGQQHQQGGSISRAGSIAGAPAAAPTPGMPSKCLASCSHMVPALPCCTMMPAP